jgi:diphthine-ammonia ligase
MYAVATSGGKDSTLALYCAQQQGLSVTHLFHVYGTEHGRVRFHGYRPEMISAQAEAVGLAAIVEPTRADHFDEDFGRAMSKAKEAGIKGLIFGNLHLQDVSDYYRRLVEGAGLEHREMLWLREPMSVLSQFVQEGFRAVITSVWLRQMSRDYLGREIDPRFIEDVGKLEGVDPCGERGEYHSLAYDGPCFKHRLQFTTHGVHEEPDYAFLDVQPA